MSSRQVRKTPRTSGSRALATKIYQIGKTEVESRNMKRVRDINISKAKLENMVG